MRIRKLYKKLKSISGTKVTLREPLFKHTSIRIGGRASVFIIPKSEVALSQSLRALKSRKNSIFIIGNGSNLLLPDKGIDGVVIKVGSGLDWVDIKDSIVRVGSGMPLQKLLGFLARKGLHGLEFAAGVPASIGGAVVMNLGAYGKQIGKFVKEVKTLNFNGKPKIWKRKDMHLGYRSSIFQNKKLIVIEVTLKLRKGRPKAIKKKIERVLNMRKSTQPLSVPSAGSIFKNPQDGHAGKLIESCGAKGLRLGDAQVSTKHANFIINLGGARAKDVILLMEKVRKIVKAKTNINLVPEIKIVET